MGEMLVPLLEDTDRVSVEFSFTVHTVRKVPNALQLHLALKFEYDPEIISPVFGQETPAENFKRINGQKCHIIPYMIINAVEDIPISWTFERKSDKLVTERIETITTLTYVAYKTFYPFELEVLPMKIVMDGTKNSNLVNLKAASGSHAFRYGVLLRSTSEVKISSKEDFVCRMFAREHKETGKNIKIATCIYAAFMLECDWWQVFENGIKYVGISSMLLLSTPFLGVMDTGNAMSTGLAVILAQVGLLYVLPDNDDFTCTEQLIVSHLLYVLGCTVYWGWVKIAELAPVLSDTASCLSPVQADSSSAAAANLPGAASPVAKAMFISWLWRAFALILLSLLWLARGGMKCRKLRTKMWASLQEKIRDDTDVGLMKAVEETL